MKKFIFLFSVLLIISFQTFALQPEKQKKEKVYSFGMGIMNENDIGNFGIVVTNDLKIYLLRRFGVNPRLSYFQSLGLNTYDDGFSSYSAIFIGCGLFYSVVKNKKMEITINAGPSGVFGNSTNLVVALYENGKLVNQRFDNEYIRNMAYFTDLEFSWGKRKIVNTLAIKATGMYIFPEFLGIVYKIGFRF